LPAVLAAASTASISDFGSLVAIVLSRPEGAALILEDAARNAGGIRESLIGKPKYWLEPGPMLPHRQAENGLPV
jgi:hypothetical protein